jgi:FkbM family methyltransferase
MNARKLAKYWLYNAMPGFSGRFPYFGTAVHFPRHAALFRAVCEQGIFEADIVHRMTRLSRPGTTVMDVGANLGLMSVPVLQHCASCRVISFEPSPSSLPYLERTHAGCSHRDRWTIVGAAVAARPGDLDFTVGSSAHDALYEGFRSGDRIAAGRTIKVPVTTLDDTWRKLGEPEVSLIKIDVEGAEAGVLAGATTLLGCWRPAILIEWYAPYLARFQTPSNVLLRLATSHDYRVFTVPAGVPVDDERALTTQMIDCQNFLLLGA